MRIVIADDAGLLRDSLSRALSASGLEVVGEAWDAPSLLTQVEATAPDVALVDIRMPPTHTLEGLEAATEIRARFPGVAVLVLSQFVETEYAVRLITETSDHVGYLLKDHVTDLAMLQDALERVVAGGTVIDPEIVRRIISRRREHDPVSLLTPREREILGLMAEGRSNRAIASALVVSERTVESHVASILTKFGLIDTPDTHRRVLAVLTFLRS